MAQHDHLIHDIITGIHALAEHDKKLDKEKDTLEKQDYKHTETIPAKGQDEAFLMKDYAPKAFYHIRKLCGISQDSYLNSWRLPKDKAKLEQSAGRSGSLFFRTDDKKYFFKTILHPEVGTLMSILEHYIKHIEDGKSFIMRLVGLHRIAYGSDKVWVLVMKNSFPTFVGMTEIFDLKGRKPKPGKSFQERGRKTPQNNPQKDNEITRALGFTSPTERQHFIDQLKKDVDFLNDHNLMDYSLLVGVHKVNPEEKASKPAEPKVEEEDTSSKKKKKKSKKKSAEAAPVCDLNTMKAAGGYMGKNPTNGEEEIYFIGVIDCLTSYIFKKKLAFAFKRVLWDPDTLSTVKAKFYAKRFLTFMTHNLLGEDQPTKENGQSLEKKEKDPKEQNGDDAPPKKDKKAKGGDAPAETKTTDDAPPKKGKKNKTGESSAAAVAEKADKKKKPADASEDKERSDEHTKKTDKKKKHKESEEKVDKKKAAVLSEDKESDEKPKESEKPKKHIKASVEKVDKPKKKPKEEESEEPESSSQAEEKSKLAEYMRSSKAGNTKKSEEKKESSNEEGHSSEASSEPTDKAKAKAKAQSNSEPSESDS